jgi:hypothetical protein
MEITFEIKKKHMYLLVGVLIIMAGVFIVDAQGGFVSPSHSLNEFGEDLDKNPTNGILDQADHATTADLADLADDLSSSQDFDVYSCDDNLNVAAGEMRSCDDNEFVGGYVASSGGFGSKVFTNIRCCNIRAT